MAAAAPMDTLPAADMAAVGRSHAAAVPPGDARLCFARLVADGDMALAAVARFPVAGLGSAVGPFTSQDNASNDFSPPWFV